VVVAGYLPNKRHLKSGLGIPVREAAVSRLTSLEMTGLDQRRLT